MAKIMAAIARQLTVRFFLALLLIGTGILLTNQASRAPAASAPKAAPFKVALPKTAPAPVPTANTFIVKRVLDIPGPFHHGDYAWDDKGVPPGPIVITVDLAAQTLSIFRGGYEIGAAVIIYGGNGKETPLGTFPISQKDAHHWSTLYDAPMPYMLRLTSDGVAIHASDIASDHATHGCIGVPLKFAQMLFAQAKLGDPVIITNGKMMDVKGIKGARG